MDRPFSELDDLYREVVLDHYRSPRGREPLDSVDVRHEGFNPVCGDEVEVALDIRDNEVKNAQICTRGCAISVASGSMLAELLPGLTEDEVEAWGERFRAMLHGEAALEGIDLGDLEALRGVSNFPVRIKCALLPWMTLTEAIRAWREGKETPRVATSTEEANE